MLAQAIYHPDQTRRVAIYQRADGSYCYAAEELTVHKGERLWLSEQDLNWTGIYDSVETALREAEGEIPWLREHRATERAA